MILTQLMPHQNKALVWLHDKEVAALFMFLGSGKTLVSLAKVDSLGVKRVLVTSDKSNVLTSWPEEIARHTDFNCIVRPDTVEVMREFLAQPGVNIVVTNYDIIRRRLEVYQQDWEMWIGDESALVKDQRTKRFKALKFILTGTKRRMLLNGKPLTERLEDIWGQVSLLDEGAALGRTMTQFRTRYMWPHPNGYGWIPRHGAMERIHRQIQGLAYIVESDPTVKMPERKYTLVTVPMTEEIRRHDEELKKLFESSLEQERIETNYAAVVYIKRLQLCGGVFRGEKSWLPLPTAKLTVLEKIVRQNPSAKIAVWHTYIPETAVISKHLQRMGVPFVVYTGDVEALSQYRSMEAGVLLIRTAFCRGLNQLADTDIAVFYSNPLSYQHRAQAEGRSRRISSKTDVTHYVDLVTEKGADTQVYRMLQRKQSFSLKLSELQALSKV